MTDLMPAADLSEREEWALRMSLPNARTSAENRELLDFLGYPETLPRGADLVLLVARRILEARACGEHIADPPQGTLMIPADPCPYDFSHTRHWCGYGTCRDS